MKTAAPPSSRSEKAREAKDVLDQCIHDLARELGEGKSEALRRFLDFSSRFHSYSFRNVMLILQQRPDATRVAGLRTWNRLGRHVRAGEKGIMIFAPMKLKKSEARSAREENGREPEDGPEGASARNSDDMPRPSSHPMTLFKVVHVFDAAQTDGDPLPDLGEADGDAEACLPALEKAVGAAGIMLERGDTGSSDGFSTGGKIVVSAKLEGAEAFHVLAHEFAHELLHWPNRREDLSRRERKTLEETEAEAAAYVVCRRFGIECPSADYLMLHHADEKLLMDRLETVRSTAARIIDAILAAQGRGAELEAELS